MKRPEHMLAARKGFYDAIDSRKLSLSQTLKAMRKLIGKTQKEFSELVGVALPAIRSIEQGRGNPTLETLIKIGQPFGLTLGFKREAQRKLDPSIDLCQE